MSYPSAPPPSEGVNPYGNQPGEGDRADNPATPSQQPDVPQPPSSAQPWQTPAVPAYGTPPPSAYDAPPAPPTPSGYGSPSQQYGQPTYGGPSTSYSPYLAAGHVPGAPGYSGWYASSRDNGKGTGALIMGILSIVLCFGSLLGIGLGIGAVIMGSQGRRAVAGGTADNGGVATTGYVLGIIGIVLGVITSLGYLTNAVQ